jgi:predicted O-methyltransferase YrrM
VDLIDERVRAVMARLEDLDARDRVDGTPRSRRLRAVTPEVGEFLLTVALGAHAKTMVEIGTSGGYSTLWLAVAAARNGGLVTTFEVDPAKVAIARRTFDDAGIAQWVDSRHEDGLGGLLSFRESADMVFIDAEKEDYESFLEGAVGALRPGGCLVADNLLSHEEDLAGFCDAALSHPRLHGLVVPIGRGELLAVKL